MTLPFIKVTLNNSRKGNESMSGFWQAVTQNLGLKMSNAETNDMCIQPANTAVIAPIYIHAPGATKVKDNVHLPYIYTTVRHLNVHCVLRNAICSVIISLCKAGRDATPNRRACVMTTRSLLPRRGVTSKVRASRVLHRFGGVSLSRPQVLSPCQIRPVSPPSAPRNPNKATVRSPDMPSTNRTPRFKVFPRHHNAKSTYDHRTS